ncbi:MULTISPECIES: peptidyl-prolyl cis-trans isomerase [Bacillaceae]|uniref:peptidyl-prolyl cis-trans isomerase n=1 Tax=Bacillaceae TaxID=186817 RepID=UPI001C5863A8|nr:peptidyl-prolyl cis-trans isomerase [Rossellomorea sp. YZS02]MBW3114731.1 peptidyl-prolyl cis-trans isomerase [Bacillus sp. MCCB 382]MDX8345971.1 peptidyl-prolyl cis-trans isomerase [Rossellomorea sp. YZS02]
MRIKRSVLMGIIGVLLVTNLITLVWNWSSGKVGTPEVVASVGGESVTREDWLYSLEQQHGKEELRALINQKVIEQLAEKYDIDVSNKEVEQEYYLIQSVYNAYDEENFEDEETLKKQIRSELLLEELITKDVQIPEKELEKFYTQNEDQYSIPKMYKLKQLKVADRTEVEQVIEELDAGSNFEALAIERSIDEQSAHLGGDIGYVPLEGDILSDEAKGEVEPLSQGEWTSPIQQDEGYVIYYVDDILKERHFAYKDVKSQIRRQIALEQVETPLKPESFWDEMKVDWFYGKHE